MKRETPVAQPTIRPAHQCSSLDRFETVTDRSEAEALLGEYRGDRVAMHRLREILSDTTPDIFRHDDQRVLTLVAGKIVQGELRVIKSPCSRKNDENRRYLDWIVRHRNDVLEAADILQTTVQNILGLAAVESDFGQNRFATDGNNFFALSTTRQNPLPGQIGLMIAQGDPNIGMARFEDFQAPSKAFALTSGQMVKGEIDPARFATILQSRGKFGTGPRGPVPGYLNQLTEVIHELAIRLNC
jgi:hypothetical protein